MQTTIKRLAIAFLLTCGLGVGSAMAQSSSTGNITESATTCGTGGATNGRIKLHLPTSIGLIPGSVSVTITGTFVSTLEFEQSADNGTTWTAITGAPQPSGAATASTTSTGLWAFDVASRTDFCVRSSAYTSGTARIVIQSSPASAEGIIAAAGITSLNEQTDSEQTFVTDDIGIDFNIISDSGVHSFNIPDASATARGLVTTEAQIFAGSKTFLDDMIVDGDFYNTGNASFDNPIEIAGIACGTAEANVGLIGFDTTTGTLCYSYDGSAPAPVATSPDRFSAGGTPLVDGDFALSAGWGDGSPTVTVTSDSYDAAFHVTITADGVTGLNPTVAFTFSDGTWTNVPIFVCNMENGGTGAMSFFTPDNTSATVLTMTYAGTPVNGLTYKLACTGMGVQ